MSKAIESVTKNCEQILTMAEDQIEAFLRGDRTGKFGVTSLSHEIAKTANCSFQFAYSIVSDYLLHRPDLRVKRGPGGGIQKVEEASSSADTVRGA